jgi:hypothetical protein
MPDRQMKNDRSPCSKTEISFQSVQKPNEEKTQDASIVSINFQFDYPNKKLIWVSKLINPTVVFPQTILPNFYSRPIFVSSLYSNKKSVEGVDRPASSLISEVSSRTPSIIQENKPKKDTHKKILTDIQEKLRIDRIRSAPSRIREYIQEPIKCRPTRQMPNEKLIKESIRIMNMNPALDSPNRIESFKRRDSNHPLANKVAFGIESADILSPVLCDYRLLRTSYRKQGKAEFVSVNSPIVVPVLCKGWKVDTNSDKLCVDLNLL